MVAQISRRRTVRADAQRVWDVLADFGAIGDWMSVVDHSCVLSTDPDGPVGTTRRVQIRRVTLLEAITEFDAPTTLAYDIAGRLLCLLMAQLSNTMLAGLARRSESTHV